MKIVNSLKHLRTIFRKQRHWVALLIVVLAILAGTTYYQRTSGKEDPAGRMAGNKTPVQIATAKSEDVAVYLNALGNVTPVSTVTVRARVEGQLMRVLFREGQTVKAGDLLAEIDPRPFQVQLTQTEGQMARDQALLANAQLDLERYRTLYAQDSVAKQQLDTQQALVRQYEGAVKVDQGAVDNVRLQLGYTRITAPIGGRLGLRQVDVGNMVRQSDANGLVVIAQVRPMTTVFSIPETSLPAVLKGLASGAPLPVEAYDRDGKIKLATGALLSMDNLIDPTTGTVKLKASFGNEDDALFPNQFVNVKLRIDTLRDATVVPQAAIQRGTQGAFVYVVQADETSSTVSIRSVQLGPVSGEQIVVERGLTPGEQIVIDGADKLREGAAIEAIVPQSAAAPETHKRAGREGGKKGGKKRGENH